MGTTKQGVLCSGQVRMRTAFVAVALVANLLLVGGPGASDAHACTCALVSTEKQIRTSDVVFSGEVQSVEPGAQASDVSPLSLGRVTFEVRESWKGAPGEYVEVYGHGPGMSCGIKFDEGTSHLVYAYRSSGDGEDSLQTGLCESTKPLEQADDDLLVLGSPEGSLPDTGGYGVSPFKEAAILVALSALLVSAGILALQRRMRRPR
jgi:hypothetical protein